MKTIATDGDKVKSFDTINQARAWCVQYHTENPQTNLLLEVISGGVKGWVIRENDQIVWKKNLNSFYEFYTVTKRGSLLKVALLNDGHKLYDIASQYPHMSEADARKIKRPENAKAKHLTWHHGYLFQVVNKETWQITRQGWTFYGVLRFTDIEKECIIYTRSRQIVEISDKTKKRMQKKKGDFSP